MHTSLSTSPHHRTFSRPLLRWYKKHRRDLPWRISRDPYRILLSEIMLQQTQVKTVIPYYHRFLKSFPTFATLAKAPLESVLKHWEGLGYYSRARNLHALSQAVMKLPTQTLPTTFDAIIELPGIGRYTAGAVLSMAYGQAYPVVDGNVERVFARFFGIRKAVGLTDVKKKIWKLADELLIANDAGDYNQAVMELGALICTPQNPDCPKCPVQASCIARKRGLQNVLPIKKKKAPVPHKPIGAAVIWKGKKILIDQRPLDGLLGGLWEFPGGKLEKGETMKECIRREVKEELDIDVRVCEEFARIDHAYSHFKITLFVHTCQFVRGTPKAMGCRQWKWVYPKELKKFAFPAANQPVIEKLLEV